MSNIKCGHLSGSESRIYEGFQVSENGKVSATFFDQPDLNRACGPVPVIWNRDPENLYYWNWRGKTPINNLACDLITHPGFIIRGEALVITAGKRWHTFRVAGDEQHARSLKSAT